MMFIDGEIDRVGSAWHDFGLQRIPTYSILKHGEEVDRDTHADLEMFEYLVEKHALPGYEKLDDDSSKPACENKMYNPASQQEFDMVIW